MGFYKNGPSDDTAGVDVIGTSAAPAALGVADTYVSETGITAALNYRQVTWHPFISNVGTATKITVKVEWSEDGANLAQQGFESITAGVFEYTAVAGALPPIPLPVIAPGAKVSIKADIGTTTTCYVRVVRQA